MGFFGEFYDACGTWNNERKESDSYKKRQERKEERRDAKELKSYLKKERKREKQREKTPFTFIINEM